jgi:hypothetical protein
MTTDEKVEKLAQAMQSLVQLLRGGTEGSPIIRSEDDQITLTVIEHTLREVIAGHPVGGE